MARVLLTCCMRFTVLASTVLVLAMGGALAELHVLLRVEPPTAAQGGEQRVWRSGTSVLRLTEQACPFRELAEDLEHYGVPPARSYVVQQKGKEVLGCWAPDMGGDVLTREPTGLAGFIPADWFRREGGG
jgi:hypothetical protein